MCHSIVEIQSLNKHVFQNLIRQILFTLVIFQSSQKIVSVKFKKKSRFYFELTEMFFFTCIFSFVV